MRIEGTREGTKARKARMDNDVNMILMYFDDETVVVCIKVYAEYAISPRESQKQYCPVKF